MTGPPSPSDLQGVPDPPDPPARSDRAWHPDPTGRAHFRWWDGRAWTGRVSNWGQEWADPPGSGATMPDLTVLAEPSLAFAYGAVGIESAGRWEIFDPSGRRRGSVVVEVQGLLGARRYVMLDPADQIMLVVDPRDGFSSDADLLDFAGRPHGLFDGQAFSNMIRFTIAGAVYGQAAAQDGANSGVPLVRDDVDHFALALCDGQGAQFGSLVNHEARRGLGSFFGQAPPPGQLQPEQSWFQLDRRPDLAEPLRTFALAFPCVYAHRVHLARQARRRSRHHRHH